ncbi:hypothetical protein WDU94_007213 [Cyamophila willieti]
MLKNPEFSQSPPLYAMNSPSNAMLIEQPKSSPSVTLHYKPNNPKVGVIKPKQNASIPNSEPDMSRKSTDSEEIKYDDDTLIQYNSEGSPGYQVPNSPTYQLHSPPNYFNQSPPSGHLTATNEYHPTFQPQPVGESHNSFQLIQRHSPNYEPYIRYSPTTSSDIVESSYTSDSSKSSSTFLNNYTKFLHCTSEYDAASVPVNNVISNFESQPATSLPFTSLATSTTISPPTCISSSIDVDFQRRQDPMTSACTSFNFPNTLGYSFAPATQQPFPSSTSSFPSSMRSSHDFSDSNDVLGQSYFQPPPVLPNDTSTIRTSMAISTDFQSPDSMLTQCSGGSNASNSWCSSNIKINS